MIRLDKLIVGYKEILLTIESLELDSSKVYALVGPNGKGKSTFLKTINGLLKPLSGEIFLDKTELSSLSRMEIAKKISFVTPKFDGIEHLSVFDYVSLGRTPYVGFLGKLSEKDHSKVSQILTELQLIHLSDKSTLEISDGERQMSSIARSLAQETPYITLDEPTAFLDYVNKIRFVRQLKKIAAEQAKCVIISTHDLDLCLEEQIEILYINSSNEISVFSGHSKEELLASAFTQILD
jgi:iron complex transport system ATP-binding protein